MTLVYILLIIVQIAILVFFLWWNKNRRNKPQVAAPKNAYGEFRDHALSINPAQLKIAIPNSEILVYGVVMDWDLGDAIATIAVYINGAASMYFSTGGGKTGGGLNPVVGEAAVELVTTAQQYLDHAEIVVAADAPVTGFITFYFLTNQKLFKAQLPLSHFESNQSPWYPLFRKASQVVSAMHNGGNPNAHLN